MKRDCQCKTVRHEHGTYLAYATDRCHCEECRVANNAMKHKQRMRHAQAKWAGLNLTMVDACGTRRRLEALAAVGWSTIAIGQHLGVTQQAVCELRKWPGRLQKVTADRVTAVYDELWDKPARGLTVYVINHARRHGYLPPMAWDDDTIDDPTAVPMLSLPVELDEVKVARAARGERLPLTNTERQAVVAILTQQGLSAKEIARRLHTYPRKVQRDRSAA